MFGVVGQPLNRHSPFYLGFFGASGAMLAFGLWSSLGRLTTTITLLLVSFFLALALNPSSTGSPRTGCGVGAPSAWCSPG